MSAASGKRHWPQVHALSGGLCCCSVAAELRRSSLAAARAEAAAAAEAARALALEDVKRLAAEKSAAPTHHPAAGYAAAVAAAVCASAAGAAPAAAAAAAPPAAGSEVVSSEAASMMDAPEAAVPPRLEPGPVTAQTSAFLQALAAKAADPVPPAGMMVPPAAIAAAVKPAAALIPSGHPVHAASRRKHPSFAPSSSQRNCSSGAKPPVNGTAEAAAEAAEWAAEPAGAAGEGRQQTALPPPHAGAAGPQPWLEEGPRSGKKRRLTDLMAVPAVGIEGQAPRAAALAASPGARKQPSSGDSSYAVSAANGGTTESGSGAPDQPLSRLVLPPRKAAMTAAANLKQQALSTSSDSIAPSLSSGEQPKRSAISSLSTHGSRANGSSAAANGSRKKAAEAGSKGLSQAQLADFILPPRRAAVAAAGAWKQQAGPAAATTAAAAAAACKGTPAPSAGRRAGSAGGGGGRRSQKQEAAETEAICARALPQAEAYARARVVREHLPDSSAVVHAAIHAATYLHPISVMARCR
jgi:hypothetical protein